MMSADRKWVRAMKRRIRAEVRANRELRRRRRTVDPGTLRRSRPLPLPLLRALLFVIVMIVALYPSKDASGLLYLVCWGAILVISRWVLLVTATRAPLAVAHLPVRGRDCFSALWRADMRRWAIFGLESWIALGRWLQETGSGAIGWLIALPLAAGASLGTAAVGAGLASLNRPHWLNRLVALIAPVAIFSAASVADSPVNSASVKINVSYWIGAPRLRSGLHRETISHRHRDNSATRESCRARYT